MAFEPESIDLIKRRRLFLQAVNKNRVKDFLKEISNLTLLRVNSWIDNQNSDKFFKVNISREMSYIITEGFLYFIFGSKFTQLKLDF